MGKLIGSLVLTFILAGPCLAEAECAWVLWLEITDVIPRYEPVRVWGPIIVLEKRAECEDHLASA